MKILRFILYLIIMLFFISSKSHSQESFIITSELLEIIPNEHLSFLEGFDETASFDTLENVKWSEKRYNVQSMVDGYWVRFQLRIICQQIVLVCHITLIERRRFL